MNIMQVKDWILQRMMELAIDKMYNRGYDPTAVSKVKNEIRLYSADMEISVALGFLMKE